MPLLKGSSHRMCRKAMRQLDSYSHSWAIAPMVNGVARTAHSFKISRLGVFAVMVFVMYAQRAKTCLTALFTRQAPKAFDGFRKSDNCVATVLQSSVHKCRAFSRTKSSLTRLECLASCNNLSARQTWRPLKARERTIGTPCFVHLIARVRDTTRRAYEGNLARAIPARLGTKSLTNALSQIMAFERDLTAFA